MGSAISRITARNREWNCFVYSIDDCATTCLMLLLVLGFNCKPNYVLLVWMTVMSVNLHHSPQVDERVSGLFSLLFYGANNSFWNEIVVWICTAYVCFVFYKPASAAIAKRSRIVEDSNRFSMFLWCAKNISNSINFNEFFWIIIYKTTEKNSSVRTEHARFCTPFFRLFFRFFCTVNSVNIDAFQVLDQKMNRIVCKIPLDFMTDALQ